MYKPLKQRAIHFFTLLSVLFLLAACGQSHDFTAFVNDPPIDIANFKLSGSDGSVFQLDDVKGKYILLSFGYTHCPDVCPTTLAQLRVAREKLGADASKIAVVFISVDPERDTPEIVKNYAHAFADDFIGVSGKAEEIDAASAEFSAKYKIDKSNSSADASYEVSHSAYVYVIDPDFKLRLTIPFGAQAAEIAGDLQALING